MNCFICEAKLAENSLPKEKTLEKFRLQYGRNFTGFPCCNCIKVFKKKNENTRPINAILRAVLKAIDADNYPAFFDAKSETESYMANCEKEVAKCYAELAKKIRLKDQAMQQLDRLSDELRKSPRASYYLRRIEADRFIGKREVRETVFSRNDFKCIKCTSRARLTIDHIIPVVAGGTDSLDNLQTLCFSCNASKGGRIL